MRQIDAHQHFWRYTAEEFGWIGDPMAAIRRDFLPGDLRPLLDAAGIDATIAVQARQSIEETDFLLGLAAENDWIAGVVGWAPLGSSDADAALECMAAHPKLRGVRHGLQAEPDEYFHRADFNAGIALLPQFGLTYDLLIVERQLPAAIKLVDRHPNQPFILDHIAKPLIESGQLEPWRSQITEVARRPNVTCKLSGMVTEADLDGWTEDNLRPYVETVLDAFGPSRLLFGSDWPVCTVAASYGRWADVVRAFIATLGADEQRAIFGGNAEKAYNLSTTRQKAESI